MNALGHSFEVWATGKVGPFLESPEGSELVASFSYFQEALDYRDYARARGVAAVVRTIKGPHDSYGWARTSA